MAEHSITTGSQYGEELAFNQRLLNIGAKLLPGKEVISFQVSPEVRRIEGCSRPRNLALAEITMHSDGKPIDNFRIRLKQSTRSSVIKQMKQVFDRHYSYEDGRVIDPEKDQKSL